MNAAARIKELREQINRHDYLYYVKNTPEISDQQYDALFKELKDLEAAHPELIMPDSPTQRVGGQPLEGFKSVRHAIPMLSLDNSYDEQDLKDFTARIARFLGEPKELDYVAEPKFDGVAISLNYRDGLFVLGATRGDGEVGDDVTANLRTIRSIPLRLKDAPTGDLTIRGEVLMPHKTFLEINKLREEAGEAIFANPRNACAGSLKLLDPRLVAERHLTFFAYMLIGDDTVRTQWDALNRLEELGCHVTELRGLCHSLSDILSYIHGLDEKRHQLTYDIDGVVFKVNDFDIQRRLGFTARSPRWAIAYKYMPERAETKVLHIIPSVGRTGVVTPVAELEARFISGSTVTHASLFNEEELAKKDIREGDTVIVEKAGEVIPYVVEVVKDKRPANSKPYEFPHDCPVCHTPLVKEPGMVARICPNKVCPAKVTGRLELFGSRGAMDITGLGEKVVAQLVNEGLVADPGDLFKLTVEQLEKLPRFARKSAENLVNAIVGAKKKPLEKLLYALGIPGIGETTARDLAMAFGSLGKLEHAGKEELQEIPGIGPVAGASVYDFFHSHYWGILAPKLRAAGISPEQAKVAASGPLLGKTLVVTGTLAGMSREEAHDAIRTAGGKAADTVTSKTSYLVAGENPGSKLEKARQLGVQIVDEATFLKLLKGTVGEKNEAQVGSLGLF